MPFKNHLVMSQKVSKVYAIPYKPYNEAQTKVLQDRLCKMPDFILPFEIQLTILMCT